jgi:hypothetical protein
VQRLPRGLTCHVDFAQVFGGRTDGRRLTASLFYLGSINASEPDPIP